MMVDGNRDLAEETSLKIAFLLFQGFTVSLDFLLPQASVCDNAWFLLSLLYFLYKLTSVYLPTGSFRKASPETPNIDENEKRIKRLEKLKRDLQNIKNERDILQGILAKYKDLNDR